MYDSQYAFRLFRLMSYFLGLAFWGEFDSIGSHLYTNFYVYSST